ncbi:Sedoheptulose 1 [Hyphodiscus hymeniophilus]|uniref:Sedoheptulose 1 n=1 Tax=Hyphodiscus hymeniophilus TaxID=353542 RepID=A0A9P7AV98_9HELO|nr:Sedoheptulose 1 [Hyphodiscus hymeniophilus]
MSSPRVFAIRHGETEWSLTHRHTGGTELDLTSIGMQQIEAIGRTSIGMNKLISPIKLTKIFCSPLKRARHTLELLNFGVNDRLPWDPLLGLTKVSSAGDYKCTAEVEVDTRLKEWDYGDYEGLTTEKIRQLRNAKGLDRDRDWNIMKDGCEGGESPDEVATRLDRLIADIRDAQFSAEEAKAHGTDIVCVAHGHILTALALRWSGVSLQDAPRMFLETGGVVVLGYEHHNLNEPAILLSEGAFTA